MYTVKKNIPIFSKDTVLLGQKIYEGVLKWTKLILHY